MKLRQVDISEALIQLPDTEFADTGGTNGWLAFPPWLSEFVEGLGLGHVKYAVLRKLPPYQGIPLHTDVAEGRNAGRRFHVPLLTHPGVTMEWPEDGEVHHLEAGWLYEVDYARPHEIVHRAPVDRVHVQINVQHATVA